MSFMNLFSTYYERVNLSLTNLINSLPFQNSSLVSAMHYGCLLGGKRIRPFLVYATGVMLHANLADLDIPATAIECIHAYSLIHDDLPAIDNDHLRRGQLACHLKYGEDIAILAGDALQSLAFSILAEQPMINVSVKRRINMISELAHASGVAGMCSGQALDINTTEQQHIELKQLEQIYHYKTGKIIRAAVRLGALAASDRDYSILLILETYANAIGLAYQVSDDILDVVEDSKILDKKQDTIHQNQCKITYPSLIGLDNARVKVQELCQEALNALSMLNAQSYNTIALQALANFIVKRNK